MQHIAIIVLSALLVVLFAFAGAIKVLGTKTARDNAAHLGLERRLFQLVGVAELAAVAGLLIGLWWPPLRILTAAALCLLILGALGSHLRAKDPVSAMAPAFLGGAAAVALLALSVTAMR